MWGASFAEVKMSMFQKEITKSKAKILQGRNLAQFEKIIEPRRKGALSNKQFGAVVSFCYKLGIEVFCDLYVRC
ncbi:glycoside hydrolase family protein [Bartonella sp. 220B]|uniref:glycoside hydrolase family protein n=1 Tax=Bartonella sp. 220B TaxID=2967260 RepID=UPI003FA4335A